MIRLLIHTFKDLRSRWRTRRAGTGDSYAAIYANTISRKLAQGKAHPTLGSRAWTGGKGDLGTEWEAEQFARRGLRVFHQLEALGLRAGMRCIDYGCGSLRVGQHVIRLLQSGCYTGLDVSDDFYRHGLSLLDQHLLSEKRPVTAVLSDALIQQLAMTPPDFLFASAVVQHVPPKELSPFFDRILKLTGPATTSVVSFVEAASVQRAKRMSWFYPADLLVMKVLELDPAVEIGIFPFELKEDDRRGRVRKALVIRRSV